MILWIAAAHAGAPSFTSIGVMDEGASPSGSQVLGLSEDGRVAVGMSWAYDPVERRTIGVPCAWSEATGMRDLGVPAGALDSAAIVAISDDLSRAVGHNGFTNAGVYELRNGARWNDIRGDRTTQVYDRAWQFTDMSRDGQVSVGGTRVPGPWPEPDEAFRHRRGVGYQTLGFLPDGVYSVATATSDAGDVVVGYGDGIGAIAAFRWTAAGGMQFLTGQVDGAPSQAFGISGDGTWIVGGYGATYEEMFRWSEAGGFEILGKPPGARKAFAGDVSADGEVVVGWAWFDYGYDDEALIWSPSLGLQTLRDALVDVYGLDLTGWTLTRASAVSDDGKVIAGTGIAPSGRYEGFVARLP